MNVFKVLMVIQEGGGEGSLFFVHRQVESILKHNIKFFLSSLFIRGVVEEYY